MSGLIDYSTGMPNFILGGIAFGPVMAIASLASTAIGTVMSAEGSLANADMAKEAGQNAEALGIYQQKQYAEEAETSVARAQRRMEEQNRRTGLVQSELTARSAGAGLTPSVGSTDLLAGQIGSRGTYASLMDLAQGQDIAGGYYNMGAAAKYQGDLSLAMSDAQANADRAAAFGSIVGGVGSMFSSAYKDRGAFGFG